MRKPRKAALPGQGIKDLVKDIRVIWPDKQLRRSQPGFGFRVQAHPAEVEFWSYGRNV
jgi:hypothetical protein